MIKNSRGIARENQTIADVSIKLYHCPSESKGLESHETSYVMLMGKGTVGGLADKDRNEDYIAAHSGAVNTILVIEAPNSGIRWTKPRDLTVDEFLDRLKNHTRNHSGGFMVAFCDGHVVFMRADISPDVFRALANPNRDKPVNERLWMN